MSVYIGDCTRDTCLSCLHDSECASQRRSIMVHQTVTSNGQTRLYNNHKEVRQMNKKCRYCGKPATRAVKWKVGFSQKQQLKTFYLCGGTPGKACNFQARHLKETRLAP